MFAADSAWMAEVSDRERATILHTDVDEIAFDGDRGGELRDSDNDGDGANGPTDGYGDRQERLL